jgi:hypothetical protein
MHRLNTIGWPGKMKRWPCLGRRSHAAAAPFLPINPNATAQMKKKKGGWGVDNNTVKSGTIVFVRFIG